MANPKLAPSVEIALLKLRIAGLERDWMQACSMQHPNVERVYRAAMRIYCYRYPLSWVSTPVVSLMRACARAAKKAKLKE